MIVVPVKEGENIERALKKFKRKFEKTGVASVFSSSAQVIFGESAKIMPAESAAISAASGTCTLISSPLAQNGSLLVLIACMRSCA